MQVKKQTLITHNLIEQGLSYYAFRKMIDKLLEQDKTTGADQSDHMVQYTRMNVLRMNRLDRDATLNPSLKDRLRTVDQPWIWLILNEAWCGSASQNLPVINKMAKVTPTIEIRIILRDEHPDIMDAYLTDGARSIPKLICLHADTLEELGTWGPRPGSFQAKALKWKDDPAISRKEWIKMLHRWYAKDKTQTLQAEFEELIGTWAAYTPQ